MQTTKISLIIDLKTAKTLGVNVPLSLLGPRRGIDRVAMSAWPKADTAKNAINVAFGGKADMPFCTA